MATQRTSKSDSSRKPIAPPRKPRIYGATVYASVSLEMAGAAVQALEHAPEIQVLDFGIEDIPSSKKKLTLRSLDFPRFWDGTEVDLYGDTETGLVVLQHPSSEEPEE